MEKKLEAIFKGTVQGVGFRYATQGLARQFAVKGFVENLANGHVRLVAEGAEEELSAFLLAIRTSALKDYIRDYEVTWSGSSGVFSDFVIKAGR